MVSRTPRLIPEEADLRPALALRSLPGAIGTHMTTLSYGEQLKHPLWQRKRLEVLQRADFKCEACCSDGKTLHVHHKAYFKGRMAWEYEDWQLLALCDTCHKDQHNMGSALSLALSALDANGYRGLQAVTSLVFGWCASRLSDLGFLSMLEDSDPAGVMSGCVALGCYEAVHSGRLQAADLLDLCNVVDGPYLPRLKALIAEMRADVERDVANHGTPN